MYIFVVAKIYVFPSAPVENQNGDTRMCLLMHNFIKGPIYTHDGANVKLNNG